jgi:ligand-binding sensor domain-containing protein
MTLNRTRLALLLIFVGTILGGAYALNVMLGKRSGDAGLTPIAATVQVTLPPHHPELPASHPVVATPPPGADARQGTVPVDPARAYTHFRVGNNSVLAIHAEGTVMWLGTSGGLVRYDTVTNEFATFDVRNGLRANGILYLGKLQGKIAVGTYGGGLSLLDANTQEWDHYGAADGLGDGFVYDVLALPSGDVWIATGAGVNRVRDGALRDRAKWDLYTVENTSGGLPNNRIYRLAAGPGDGIWIATRGGLANFRNGKWEHWTHANGLGAAPADSRPSPRNAGQAQQTRGADAGAAINPDHIAALEVGKDGSVWAGTRGAGLARFDGNAWTNYTVAEGLPSNQISTLNFDRSGRLWIGTTNGLALLNNGKFRVMTTAQGLLGANVYSVSAAGNGDLWVGALGGVAHIRRPAVN